MPAKSTTRPTEFLVTVDTEEEWDWSNGWPVDNLSVTNIRALPRFQELCLEYGVQATYFTNLAVVANETSRRTLLDLAACPGVEIGMHIHPWNTPPLTTLTTTTSRSTFIHNLPRELILQKLQSVYDGFRDVGIQPTSFRGGRYSSGPVVQEFLQDRGFLADCSVVPFTTWQDDGAPDYRARDLTPQRVAPKHPDQTPLWELPLTLAYSRGPFRLWQQCFQLVERTWLRKLRLIGLADKLGIVRKVWLNFEIGGIDDWEPFWRLLQSIRVPCICFTVHSSSLAAGPGPYTKTKSDEDRIFQKIEAVFRLLSRRPDFLSTTPSELAKKLEHQHACRGN